MIGDDITDFINESLRDDRFDADILYGIFALIPKGGTLSSIKNYRLISILTEIYKLVAKALPNRIQPVLSDYILPTQTEFFKGRCILDNVFLAAEASEWAKESSQDLVILLLDFKKAYDRVSWAFLEAAMAKLGFSSQWISWVSSLYRGAQSSLIVNGKKLLRFDITRSVRQGCPLAPYLYLFVSDVLSHMISDPTYGIEGLRFPDGTFVRCQCFADDSALFLRGTKENLQRAYEVIDIFCHASGARINWDKSYAILASENPRNWRWGEHLGLRWLQEGESARYLGFPLGCGLAQKDIDAKVMLQTRSKLNAWAHKRLSLAARILVCNHVILASIWYFASSSSVSSSVLLRIRTSVRNFM